MPWEAEEVLSLLLALPDCIIASTARGFLGTQDGLFVIITWHREAALPTPQNAAATQGCRQGQCAASCFQLEPEFLIRENCEGFRNSGQNPEETNQKDFKFTSCLDCGFASHWDLCLDYQLAPALGKCCKGALGRSFVFLILVFFLESDKSLSVRSQFQPRHLAVVPKNLQAPGGRGELGACGEDAKEATLNACINTLENCD